MATRIVMIHPGPSCECSCDLCRDDGCDATPWQHDCDGTCDRQGRSCAQVESNERAACWIWLAGAVLAVVIALWAAGRAVGL